MIAAAQTRDPASGPQVMLSVGYVPADPDLTLPDSRRVATQMSPSTPSR